MKFKRILIVGLILAIFAIGAVSASEDMASDDNLTVETEIDDSVQEIDDSIMESDDSDSDEKIGSSDEGNEEIVGADYDPSKINCGIYSDRSLDDARGVVVFRSTDSKAVGDLIIYIENNQRLKRTITYSDYNPDESGDLVCQLNIKPHQLQIDSEGLFDNWRVTFNGVTIAEAGRVEILPYTFYFEDEWGSDLDDGYYGYGDTINLCLYLPNDATSRVTVTINQKTYDVSYKNGKGVIPVDTKGWNLGRYKVTAKYFGDNNYLQRTLEDYLDIRPNVDCPEVMSYGENEQIKISASPGMSGEVKLKVDKLDTLNNIYKQIIDTDVPFSKGFASYSLSSLAEGNYIFHVYYKIGNYETSPSLDYETDIIRNTAGISSSVSPTTVTQGQYVTVKVTGPILENGEVDIYVNDKLFKASLFKTGQLTEILTDLPVGTNKVNVYMDCDENGQNYFHSKTYYVTVKAKPAPAPAPKPVKITLTLKKVSVSKSKKKITVSATLKLNGAAKKGLTVNFKFNGKKYSAKTDAKGVAKITVKKSVLKKLKVGKKVKYQASYGKVTVSKSVKVKK